MDSVQGPVPGSPQDKELYRQEFDRAVNLFQESLSAYQQSQIPHQKDEFKAVMNQALQVIHQTIQQALTRQPEKRESQLNQDYQKFLANDSPQNIQQLSHDLKDLSKSH